MLYTRLEVEAWTRSWVLGAMTIFCNSFCKNPHAMRDFIPFSDLNSIGKKPTVLLTSKFYDLGNQQVLGTL